VTGGLSGVATGWSFVKCNCSYCIKGLCVIMLTELCIGEFTVP